MDRRRFLNQSALIGAGLVLDPGFLFEGFKPKLAVKPGVKSLRKVNIPVLVLKGRPRERGRVHGEEFRQKIAEALYESVRAFKEKYEGL